MPSTLQLNNYNEQSSGIGGQLLTMGAYQSMYGISEAIEMQPLREPWHYNNWKKMLGFNRMQKQFTSKRQFRDFLYKGKYGTTGTKMFDPNLFDIKMNKDFKDGRMLMKDFSKTKQYKNVNLGQRSIYKAARVVNVFASFEGTESLLELGETLVKGLFINPILERGKQLAAEEDEYFTKRENQIQTSQQQLVQSEQMNMYRQQQDQEIMNTYTKIQENQRSKSVENPYVMYRYY